MGTKTTGRFVYASATPQAVAAGGSPVFANATVSNGCLENAGNGVIKINRPGLYRVAANFTMVGTAAGAVNVQLLHNGTPVPGAQGAATLAANGYGSVSYETLVTVRCCGGDSLQFEVDAATSMTVAAAIVEKAA